MGVKVRFPPSPTGKLHIGNARAALFNWLFARRHGGEFILRIEDTDRMRSRSEFEEDIIRGLRWLGLDWDNDAIVRQSERTASYRIALERLLDAGNAFWREYTTEEKAAMEKDGRTARDRVIVLRDLGSPDREIAFDDMIRGCMAVRAKHVGQLVIAKGLDEPLYHFAVVVDDIDMGITHVIRGEDHISNTPKQIMIYEALGSPLPQFGHLPLILGPDRSKMSKRHGAVSVSDYQKDYMPEAMLNFMGQLGYTYSQEMLTKEEMTQQFDLADVHKSGAIFDIKKLNWFNAQYIRRLTPRVFKDLVGMPGLPDEAVPIITERLERLSDVDQFSYLWGMHDYEANMLIWKTDDAKTALETLTSTGVLIEENKLTQENLDAVARDRFNGQKGSVYWPLRVALSGRKNSAGPLDIYQAIGPSESAKRVKRALEKLKRRHGGT